MKVWTISRSQVIPAKDTTYICSIHKAPQNSKKLQMVGFNSVLESNLERRHIHHFLLRRCYPPAGDDAESFFERHVGQDEECYILQTPSPSRRMPVENCQAVVHEWAVGARSFFLPDHVGIPLTENAYYMLQMHFDNPLSMPGIQLRFSLEVFYTEKFRQHEAGLIFFGTSTPGSPTIMLPPHSINHNIYGHCASSCTEKWFPPTGIHVFAAKLHTHLAGRGARMIHIRNNEELPWITHDDNYYFNFQPIRVLRDERTILPGDQLIKRCVYETTDRNGSVTVGGFSTRNEMCNGFLWYYNRIPEFGVCASDIKSDEYRNFLKIWNTTWSDLRIENIVTAPRENRRLTVSEAGNRIDWTIKKRNELQKMQRNFWQISRCANLINQKTPATTPNEAFISPRSGWGNDENVSLSVLNEILDPEYEFASRYPENIVPYKRPQFCKKN